MRLIIAGGRDFNDYDLLWERAHKIYWFDGQGYEQSRLLIDEVVSGKANGADTLGAQFAVENEIAVKEFPADWKTHGLGAGPIRNEEMAKYADEALIFWDTESKGTLDMIRRMTKKGKPVHIVTYKSPLARPI